MPSSTEVKDKLIELTIRHSQASQAEPAYALVSTFVEEAFAEHSPLLGEGDYASLSVREYELVVLLAWERVCLNRAALSSNQSSNKQSSVTFNADRDTPFTKSMALAKALRARYELLNAQLSDSASEEPTQTSGDITIGKLYREGEFLDAHVPFSVAPAPVAPSLSVGDTSLPTVAGNDGTAVLRWGNIRANYVKEFVLVQSLKEGIKQEWNLEGVEGVSYIDPSSVIAFRSSDLRYLATKVVNLTDAPTYFCLLLIDTNGRVAFSNEVSVTLVAST